MTMDKTLKEKIIDRVKKCFAKADSTRNNNEHEIKVAMDAAQNLMKQYNLSMAEVQVDEETHKVKQEIKEDFTEAKKMKTWEKYLGHILECLLPVKFYLRNTRNESWRKVTSLCFIGLEDDAALAKAMFSMFRKQVMRMAVEAGYEYKSEKRSYCLGVVETMLDRAKDNRNKQKVYADPKTQEEKLDARCTALIVIKEKAVIDYYNNLRLPNPKNRSIKIEEDAYKVGRRDGYKVNLNVSREVLV